MEQQVAKRMSDLLQEFSAPTADPCWLLCDRHPADAVACTVMSAGMEARDIAFGELRRRSVGYASALSDLGVRPGDRVATLMGKSADLIPVILGIWRAGAVYLPLFTAFAPKAIALRLHDGQARVVVADAGQEPKLRPGPDMPAGPPWQVVTPAGLARRARDSGVPDGAETTPGSPNGAGRELVHMFTSGTTGMPKGVVHPLAYAAGWQAYLEFGLGVTAEDVYWCAADPGWAYGLYAAVVAPLAAGQRTILLAGGFSVETTWQTLARLRVTNFAAAPTVYRALRASGGVPAGLRVVRASSAGEPLTPEVNDWAADALGLQVHDHFGQTELGMILANPQHPVMARPLKAGSMGRALPGWSVAVLDSGADQTAPSGTLGRLAVNVEQSPLMTFHGYRGAAKPADRFTADGRWYLTGDTAWMDPEGDVFFSARDDDVIIMAGYRIGPFEVESVLGQHPAVAECAVVSIPDEARGEVIEAFVVLRPDQPPSQDLGAELQQWVKQRYAAHAYPRAVHFIAELPKTPSGKTQRFLLRERRRADLEAARSAS